MDDVRKMNKSGLVRELKRRNLSSKGKKAELVSRLENFFHENASNGESDDGEENGLARAERLQKEIEERTNELDALIKTFHNSTNELTPKVQSTATPQATRLTQSATTTVIHSNVFSFRGMEESLNSFSGENTYSVQKWITDIEQNMIVFNWSELQRLVYAKKLLKGTAK